ncbi:MAG: type IV secretory system conjugative DNA transfer family protein [Turicibacter sp.]|nr:type IV secretory system conjugative DNA transfer family protein [Turicibacter sp.]
MNNLDEKYKVMMLKALPIVLIFAAVWYALNYFAIFGTFLPSTINLPVLGITRVQDWAVAGIVTLLFALLRHKPKDGNFSQRGKEYGSARWGKKRDIKPFMDKDPANNVILTNTEGLTMNSRPAKPQYGRNKNILVVGGSGTGKTRFYMKPNLMQAALSRLYGCSVVVTDPKGTILEEVGYCLANRGFKIKTLNTIDFAKTMKYNPLAYIKSEKDILSLVTALMANTSDPDKKGGDDFWGKTEQLLYCALISFIHSFLPKNKQNLNTLVKFIRKMEVREDDENFKNPIDLMFDCLAMGEEKALDRYHERDENGEIVKYKRLNLNLPVDPEHFCVTQYEYFKLAAGKTAKSILISCAARLAPFAIKEVAELVSEDEMELDKIGGYKDPKTGKTIKQKVALFVIISDTDKTYNFIVGLMYSQMFNLLCTVADTQFGGRLPLHVRCLLDEFANIGQIPEFDKLIATIRSREISATIVLQTYTQLKNIYKDNAATIIGNCDTKLFLGGGEKETLKEWVETLGKETIDTHNESENLGAKSNGGSRSFQKLGRELLTVDELALLEGDQCLMQIRGARPFKSVKYQIERHPLYKELLDGGGKKFEIQDYLESKKNKAIKAQNAAKQRRIAIYKKQMKKQPTMCLVA